MRLWRWYSICSSHQGHEAGCERCATGVWVFEPIAKLSRLFYRISPSLWRWWANR